MKKRILMMTLLTFLVTGTGHAGNRIPTLSERFDNCMNNLSCAPSERMALLVKVSAELQKSAEAMQKNCIDNNYKSCIGPRSSATLQWYKMYSYLAEIADSLEGSGLTERDLPALPPEENKIEQLWPNWYQAEKTK